MNLLLYGIIQIQKLSIIKLKYIYGNQLQELLNKGTETLQQNKAQKWLSDDRNNNALTLKDQEWANNIWFPNTAKVGWKY
ncbi:hypothetical protein DCCM_3813 [Desulfocucumis palustris]|uniref:Uncharacterized protein n=1 Tax=Desulfocucumis palustris TaxID=1898651 RepID=A0A2L2XG51_9FIRM|nr:hypothetical protein DCCM_3813 [Desulfocucumis palustris]